MGNGKLTIVPYTKDEIPAVVQFENDLRAEEDVWGWEIDDAYVKTVQDSFLKPVFQNAVSLLAYMDGKVVGRIDASIICSRFDGVERAYLDWICVLKSYRHKGVAQALLDELKKAFKEKGITSIVALTAANDEAQRFYKSIPDSEMHDVGIWIEIK